MSPASGGGTIKRLPISLTEGLPTFANNLIGRAEEVGIVRDALLGDEIRLLTLSGPAGLGKTRLALEVADQLASEFPDGVKIIDLSLLSDPGSVPSTIAQALRVQSNLSDSPLDSLHQYLQDRRLLLVLDTFEHVSADAWVLSDLLAAHPELRILVTSRQPLHLKWEHVLILDPLPVPDLQHLGHVDDLAQFAAVQLFVQIAQAVRLDFALTPENAEDVASICAYLEGVPLAIELAAGWTTLLPPATIRTYLSRELSFLHGRTRDVPPRQQSLAAALDWSYGFLDPPEQALFRRLSVFVDGFTIDAATAVVGDTGLDILDGLEVLVDKSLLQLGGDAFEPRFQLLKTVREYGLGRLDEAGETEETCRRHALHFLSLAEDEALKVRQIGYFIAPRCLPPPAGGAWQPEDSFSHLDRERSNLREALAWMVRAEAHELELRLTIALATYWWIRTYLAEGARCLEDAIARNAAAAPDQRVRALNCAGMILQQQGQFQSAQQILEDAAALARTVGDPSPLGEVLMNLAIARVSVSESRLDQGVALVHEALSLWREGQDPWGVALAKLHLAMVSLLQRDGVSAAVVVPDALSTLEALGDRRSAAIAWLLLVHALKLQGDVHGADSAFARNIQAVRDMNEPHLIASYADLGAWLVREVDPHRAAMLVGASDQIRQTDVSRSPYERHLHVQTMEDLHARLTEQDLENTRKSGLSLTIEQTIDILEDDAALVPVSGLEAVPPAHVELSDRELEVIRLMSEGLSNKQIADAIFVSEATAKLDIRSIYRKLGARNRAQAMGIIADRGMI